MRQIRQLMTLAALTVLETLRRPLCVLLASTYTLLCGVVPMAQAFQFGEDGRLARNGALAFHFVFGLLIAGYAAATALSEERRRGTADVVLSKPVGRHLFFLAKFAGVATVVLLFSLGASAAALLSERAATHFLQRPALVGYVTDTRTGVALLLAPAAAYATAGLFNYFGRQSFGSSAFLFLVLYTVLLLPVMGLFDVTGTFAPFNCHVEWRILPVSALITLALLGLSAFALALSTRLRTAPVITVLFLLFVLGLVSDYLFGRHADTSKVAALLHALIPNWQHFWLANVLNDGGRLPWRYLLQAGIYTVLLCAMALAGGILAFRRSDTA